MSATQSLAAYVANANTEDLPPSMLHEAKRTLINILGVSLSASAGGRAARVRRSPR